MTNFSFTYLERLKDTKFCIFLIFFFYTIKMLTNVLDAEYRSSSLSTGVRPITRLKFPPRYRAIIPNVPKSTLESIDHINPSETTLARAFDLSCLGFPHGFIDRPLSFPLRYRRCGAYHTHIRTHICNPWFVRNINAISFISLYVPCHSTDRKTLLLDVKLSRFNLNRETLFSFSSRF